MVHVSAREPTPLAFLRARVVRVVPLYWLVTLLFAAISFPAIGHLLMSLLFWPHLGGDVPGRPIVSQGWTLIYEMFFYLAFAATMLFPRRLRLLVLSVALAALSLLGLAIPAPEFSATATFTSPLLLEFLAGAWLHRAWFHGRLPANRAGWPAIAFGGLTLIVFRNTPEAWRALAWRAPMLLIAAGALGLERAGQLPRNRLLHRIGDSSYSLYLTHALLFWPLMPRLAFLPFYLAIPLLLAAAVALALLVFHIVERPLHRALSRRLGGRPAGVRSREGSTPPPLTALREDARR